MFASELPAYEQETISWLKTTDQLTDGDYLGLPVLKYSPPRSGYYYDAPRNKSAIVLHFTAGYLGGDLSTLSQQDWHVSVPFVIARNGTIIQLFEPDRWSYHLGSGTVGGNKFNSRRTIGIELSNIGYLERSGNWMWSYTGAKYCPVADAHEYLEVPEFRGKTHFAAFPRPQLEAMESLVGVLAAEFGIPRSILPEPQRYETLPTPQAAQTYSGVCTHVNFRPSGKWDIGTAFDWSGIPLVG